MEDYKKERKFCSTRANEVIVQKPGNIYYGRGWTRRSWNFIVDTSIDLNLKIFEIEFNVLKIYQSFSIECHACVSLIELINVEKLVNIEFIEPSRMNFFFDFQCFDFSQNSLPRNIANLLVNLLNHKRTQQHFINPPPSMEY